MGMWAVRPVAALVGVTLLGVGPPATVDAPARTPRWRPPVVPTLLTRAFDPPERPWLPGHRGLDLRTTEGAPVRAAGAGRVTHAGPVAGRGVVVVDHGWVRTTYEPVHGHVAVGQWVEAGQVVGQVVAGTGHCGTGGCLHLGLRRGEEYLDPALVLGTPSAVLIPW